MNSNSTFYFYILKCYSRTNRICYYKGISNDLERRINEHKAMKCKYTKRFKGNLELVHFETYKTRSKASKRENEFKPPNIKTKREIEELINSPKNELRAII